MPKTIRIRNADSEMDSVRVFLEENLKLDSREKEMTCLLICEEMITRLLQSGNDEVTVAVRGLLFPRIVLISQHPMDDGQDLMKKSEDERIETEIRRDILKQYEAYIDQEQSANQTVYSIHSVRKNGDSFKEDILRFYNRDGQSGKRKPIDLLRFLAGENRAMVGLSVLNRIVKHLCALMLPVFASGMIDTLSDCSSCFETPVLLNVLGAILALTINLICATLDARIYQRFVRGIESGFKVAIVQKLQMLSMKYYSETPSGKVFSKLASDVQFIKMLMCEQMQTFLFGRSSFQMSAIPVKDRMTYKTLRSSLN